MVLMKISIASLVHMYPQIEAFLGAIVDSGKLENLSPAERSGMIQELGVLFAQRLEAYLESVLDEPSLSRVHDMVTTSTNDAEVYAHLRSIIPQFDADLERICLAFHTEYAVGA